MSYFTAGKLHLQFVIAFNLQQWYKLDRYCCCAMIMCNKVNELSVWIWTQNVWMLFHIRFIDLSLLSANVITAEHHHPHAFTLPLSHLTLQSQGGSMVNIIPCNLLFGNRRLVSTGSCGVLSGKGVMGLSPTKDVRSLELGWGQAPASNVTLTH